ncbi:trehalose-phosphatase [Alteraurantiacibacter buctensis]|uniref:trehalose-phosphatase n=1 Tax=Alteraurantiacibacter buctensis TaxID=1503981 RepID=UPI001EED3B14|nr:trehalose-phosphatase [Alteraurantiacibacter buctensis]
MIEPPALTSDNSILLDFDGTMVDLVDRPDAVVMDAELGRLIDHLIEVFDRRVAIVSGRSVTQLKFLLGRLATDIALVGSHGAEVHAHTSAATPLRPPELDGVEQAIHFQLAGMPGVLIESKTLGVAVHYRLDPCSEPRVRAVVKDLAASSGLVMQEGKMMLELRTAGADKGTGIAALMNQPPFAGTRPVFAGDDVTDEAGFAAVARMGGHGVLVGPERPTAARYRLADVGAVRQWLGRRP